MDDEHKHRRGLWAAALRSGEYTQDTGRLRIGGGYCCLGVACEVYRIETGYGGWFIDGIGHHFFGAKGCASHHTELPAPVADWLGIEPDPQLRVQDGVRLAATAWNDGEGLSFDEIADMIEAGDK